MPQHDVSLPEYRISKQPVSNTQYEEFMRQTGKSAPIGWLSRRAPEGREDMPVTGVTWFDALEYCKWLSNLTSKKYALPNEAQLARAYMGDDGISDPVDKVYQWTCTLWGDKMDTPDRKYGHPWKDDGRNNLNANRQIRRMVCVYRKNDASTSAHLFKRTGELPGDSGLPGARYGFRVVLSA
jgi:formylglycine-generating enzyme required for sulfatase activity